MPEEFNPYHRWLGIPPEEQPADHYRLLGLVRFENDVEVIRDAAERQIAHVRRYGIGKHSELSQRILNELAAAKASLLHPENKSQYDAQLHREIEVEAVRPARRSAPEPTHFFEPIEAPPGSQVTPKRRGLGVWFRRAAVSLATAFGSRPRRTPSQTNGPESISVQPSRPWWKIGRASKPLPPPLPQSSVAPPLPAGPDAPPTPTLPEHVPPESPQVETPNRDDPFEQLRRTAIASPEDSALDDPPRPPEPAPLEKTVDHTPEPKQNDDARLCQPTACPPTAILWIQDDGQQTGQSVRMREFPFLVGRTKGHVRIPHDPAIDDLHLEIFWRADHSIPQLVIRDSGTHGGLFVRAVKARVEVGQEIRIGSGCYRLSQAGVLEEISPCSDRRLALGQPIAWLGRIPECEPLHVVQDRMADRHHVKLSHDSGEAWSIEDRGSLNGTWLRMPQVVVRSRAEILIGEQALVVEIPRYARSRT